MRKAATNEEIESALRGEGLIFQWKDRRKWRLRLAFFLLVSLALHLSCFYLFQVVYPPTERSLPHSAQITVLDSRDSATLAVMNQIEDRLAVIDSSTKREMPGLSIEDYEIQIGDELLKGPVTFKPFFRGYEMRLKSPPAVFPRTPVPDLFPPGQSVLPETHFTAGTPDVAPPWKRHPFVKVRGAELARRDLAVAIDWGATLGRFEETDSNRASFMVGVDASGRVVHCMLAEGEETGVAQLVQSKVRELRFDPKPGAELQWGWIDLSW